MLLTFSIYISIQIFIVEKIDFAASFHRDWLSMLLWCPGRCPGAREKGCEKTRCNLLVPRESRVYSRRRQTLTT